MMYRALILSLGFVLFLAGASGAQDAVDRVARRLEQQGFTIVQIERTLLGRVMIRAENKRSTREVVIDPATGEILRDYTEDKGGGSSALEEPGSAGERMAARPPAAEPAAFSPLARRFSLDAIADTRPRRS